MNATISSFSAIPYVQGCHFPSPRYTKPAATRGPIERREAYLFQLVIEHLKTRAVVLRPEAVLESERQRNDGHNSSLRACNRLRSSSLVIADTGANSVLPLQNVVVNLGWYGTVPFSI